MAMRINIATAFALLIFLRGVESRNANTKQVEDKDTSLEDRHYRARMELWSRGEYSNDLFSGHGFQFAFEDEVEMLERAVSWSPMRLGPVRKVRRDFIKQNECIEMDCPFSLPSGYNFLHKLRGGETRNQDESATAGGAESYGDRLKKKLDHLSQKLGPEFKGAIEKNEKEHAEDCKVSCESFYCADESPDNRNTWDPSSELSDTSFFSLNFGATPPEDFSEEFGFPLDLIKVTKGEPLFSAEEAARVVEIAQGEGIENNEYKSGKYLLGGDWLTNLPKTREWFNAKLESTLFPLMRHLFPEIVSSTSVLRAHSVSLLKYNGKHIV